MNHQINSIEGIGSEFSTRLNKAGVATVQDLLTKGADPIRRHKLAAESGCNESTILKWVGMADLFRVTGISTQYSELLSACGVNSVENLSNRKAPKLYKKMRQVNQAKNICRSLPNLPTLEGFINQARKLPRINFI